MTTQTRPKWKVYVVYLLSALLTFGIGVSGVQKLLGAQTWIDQFNTFGYPLWFMYLIGVLQVVGVIGLWLPRTRAWAAAGLGIIMLGAAFSNFRIGAYTFIIPNLVLIVFAVLVIWFSRVSSQK